MTRKPPSAASAPAPPRSFSPTHIEMPTTLGPGMNWQRLRISANSASLTHCRRTTTAWRTHTGPPPSEQSEVLRNSPNSAGSVTPAIDFGCSRAVAIGIAPREHGPLYPPARHSLASRMPPLLLPALRRHSAAEGTAAEGRIMAITMYDLAGLEADPRFTPF